MFVFELFQISLYWRLDLVTAHRTDEPIQVLGAIQLEPIDRVAAHYLLAYASSLAFFIQQDRTIKNTDIGPWSKNNFYQPSTQKPKGSFV